MNASDEATSKIPMSWRVTAAAAWRLLVFAVALGVLAYLLGYLALVVVPISVALLLAALLHPVVERLVRWRLPRALAVAVTVAGGLVVIAGVFTGVGNAVAAGLPGLQAQLGQSIRQINGWLANGPLQLSPHALQQMVNRALEVLKSNQASLVSGALGTVSEVLTAIALTVFTLVFFLKDGPGIWRFLTRLAPAGVRSNVEQAGYAGFAGLIQYVRATILVAAGDAVGIGIGLFAIGVPLALPLTALVFLGAFIPIAGSVTAGALAVLVTLVTNGIGSALILLAVVIVVMQLEGNVLQPLFLGHAVRLHPLAIVLAIAVGTVVAGIAGALLSAPLLTVLVAATRYLQGNPTPTGSGHRRFRPFRWLRTLLGRVTGRKQPSGEGDQDQDDQGESDHDQSDQDEDNRPAGSEGEHE